jgi:hypothetical protein
VQKMRNTGRTNQLKMMAMENKNVINLMIECLTGGVSWVTGEEKQAAEYLKTLV